MSADFDSLAKTLSHEIGHSLGASHTEQTSCQGHYLMLRKADPSNPTYMFDFILQIQMKQQLKHICGQHFVKVKKARAFIKQ